jgi:hypothetical protein
MKDDSENKERATDASYEGELSSTRDNRQPLDLTFLLEQHEKEKWDLKQQLSKAAEELTLMRGTKQLVNNLAVENTKLKQRAQEAEKNRPLNTMDEVAYRELEARVKELDNALANALEINESHQRYNGKLQRRVTELEGDNKKISSQVEDKINQMRKSGL